MPTIWKNWIGTQTATARVVEPDTLRSLKQIVRQTANEGHRMRAAGTGHSWSPLVPVGPGDTIIVMTKLSDVLSIDEDQGRVTVECGITIGQLTLKLREKGLTLYSPTLFPDVTVGGVISTGAHGTDINVGNFADQIVAMTIITWDGTERTLTEDDDDFPAAQVALGTLGIVYSVTLKVERNFSVYVDERKIPVRYVLEEVDDLIQSYAFVEIFWYPFQDHMWLYLMQRTGVPPDNTTRLQRAMTSLRGTIEDRAGEAILPYISRFAPGLTPALSWFASTVSREVTQSVQLASDAFHFQRGYVASLDMDYAVPATYTSQAWRDGISLVEEYARANVYPLNLALHCRFTGGSEAWLASDYGRRTCHIEATTALNTSGWDEFSAELEHRWISIPEARPHWGKIFNRTDELLSRYPKMADFLAVREAWDPDRVFLNTFLEDKVFQLPRGARNRPSRLKLVAK